MSARVIARTGEAAGTDFGIGDEATLGAAPGNQIRLPVMGVSREHARIWKDGDAYYIEDSGSTNGTFVNGQRIQTFRLHHLDVVSLARHVDLIFLQDTGQSQKIHGQALLEVSVEWLDGAEAGTLVDIPLGETTLGRDWSSNIAVEVTAVSKIHARLTRHGDFLTIQDLGSTNGTKVNGRDLEGVLTLNDGDQVTLGGGVTFKIKVRRDPSAGVQERAIIDTLDAEVFDQEWRTRLIWSPEELAEIESIRARVRTYEIETPSSRETVAVDDKEIEKALATADAGAAEGEPTMVAPPEMLAAVGQRAVPAADGEATQLAGMQDVAAAPGQVLAAASAAKGEPEPEEEVDGEKTHIGDAPGVGAEGLPPGVAAAAEATRREVQAVGPARPAKPTGGGAPAISGIRLVGELGSFRFAAGNFLVGRDLDADVWLDGEGVSRKHAMVYVTDQCIEIDDAGSSNGTSVNGGAVTKRQRIEDGDLLKFGGVSLRLEVLKE